MSYAVDTCIIDFLASSGPATIDEIVNECKVQCPDYKHKREVLFTVMRLLNSGSIGKYDDTIAFEILTGEL